MPQEIGDREVVSHLEILRGRIGRTTNMLVAAVTAKRHRHQTIGRHLVVYKIVVATTDGAKINGRAIKLIEMPL